MAIDIEQLCMGCMEERGASEVCARCGWREGAQPDSPLYLSPRTVLGDKYLTGRVLGCGGFGITYLGWDMTFTRKLAIKEYMPNGVASRASGDVKVTIFPSHGDNDFEYGMQQFLEEGRTVARFQDHPGVVKVIDFVRANSTAYLVMEHLDGCTLATFLSRNDGKLPFQTVLNIMTPVMDALRAVHKENFLHRDISPDNVFVLNNGGIKVIDFGAARFALSQRSKNLSVILKEGYAPPEQYSSKGNQGPWTDVYATAATIYRALTGKIPPPSLDRLEGDELPRASQDGAAIPLHADLALQRGLAIRVQDRFNSMEAFQAALSELPEGHFADAAGQRVQELLSDAARPPSHRPLSPSPNTARPFDPHAAQALHQPARQTPPDPTSKPNPRPAIVKALAAAGGIVLVLLAVWTFKPKDSSGDAPSRPCTFTVNVPAANVAAAGQQVRVSVAAGSGCPWTATTDASWITLHTATGSGSGEVTYTALSNTGQSARTGVIHIAGHPHTVTQQAPQSPGYGDLIRDAYAAFSRRDYNAASQFAHKAVAADSSKPDAYDLLGHMDLYFAGNAASAEENMRASLARGGKATFVVRHDHTGLTFAQNCVGQLHIWRNKIAFTSPEDRFEAAMNDVKEVKMNKRWLPIPSGGNNRPQGNVFHIETRRKNYNLAGTSRLQKEETTMILTFIGKE